MASKIKINLTIDPENVEIWCKRSGFTVITPLEILQNKLGLKKVKEIIFSSGDGDRVKRKIRKELRKQLIYKNEEERVEIEEKVSQLCDILIYMKENNLYEIEIGYYCKNWKNEEITKYRKYVNKHTIETYFTKLKIIDGEIVFDIYVNALKNKYSEDNARNLRRYFSKIESPNRKQKIYNYFAFSKLFWFLFRI